MVSLVRMGFVAVFVGGWSVGEEEMGAFEEDRRLVAGLRLEAVIAGMDFLTRLVLKTGSCASSSPSSEKARFLLLSLGWDFLVVDGGGCVGASSAWRSLLFFVVVVARLRCIFFKVDGEGCVRASSLSSFLVPVRLGKLFLIVDGSASVFLTAGVPDFIFLGAILPVVFFVGDELLFVRFVMSRRGPGRGEEASKSDQSVV